MRLINLKITEKEYKQLVSLSKITKISMGDVIMYGIDLLARRHKQFQAQKKLLRLMGQRSSKPGKSSKS